MYTDELGHMMDAMHRDEFVAFLCETRGVTLSCAKRHCYRLRLYFQYAKSLNNDEILKFRSQLRREGKSAATLNGYRQTFRAYAQFLGISINAGRMEQEHPKHKATLSVEEIEKFIALNPPPSPWGMFWTIYAYSGARYGAIRLLTRSQIDMDNRVFYVNDKTKESRPVVIEDIVFPHLQKYLYEHKKEYLFLSKFGTPFSQLMVSRNFYRRIKTLGLTKPLTPNSIRHSFGTRMAPNIGIERLKDLMGHQEIETTERYVHRNISMMVDASKADPAQRLLLDPKEKLLLIEKFIQTLHLDQDPRFDYPKIKEAVAELWSSILA